MSHRVYAIALRVLRVALYVAVGLILIDGVVHSQIRHVDDGRHRLCIEINPPTEPTPATTCACPPGPVSPVATPTP